ncbi:MAG: four helix bundle protein [Leptolyngbya sp. SIOISBB]|nr:four helix bundle protein [Leptolyngbya sp. SIOISBB]
MSIHVIASYQQLPVYQMAFQGSTTVYHWAQPLLATSDADVIGQLLTLSRAICADIAAAWSQRRQRAGFISHLSTAHLAATEMQSWIEAAIVTGALTPDTGQDLHDHYRDLSTALDQLMATAVAVPQLSEKTSVNALPATA